MGNLKKKLKIINRDGTALFCPQHSTTETHNFMSDIIVSSGENIVDRKHMCVISLTIMDLKKKLKKIILEMGLVEHYFAHNRGIRIAVNYTAFPLHCPSRAWQLIIIVI